MSSKTAECLETLIPAVTSQNMSFLTENYSVQLQFTALFPTSFFQLLAFKTSKNNLSVSFF